MGGTVTESGAFEVLLGIVGTIGSIAGRHEDPFSAGMVFLASVLLVGLGVVQLRKYKGWF